MYKLWMPVLSLCVRVEYVGECICSAVSGRTREANCAGVDAANSL